MQASRWTTLSARWAPLIVGVVGGGIAVAVLVAWFGWAHWGYNYGDLIIYTDAARRVIEGGSWFTDRQLHGPYAIQFGDVLYPPTLLWLVLPWLVLPAWSFVLIPVAITIWAIRRMCPPAWSWILMILCLLWPMTILKIVSANPSVWITAAVALGCLFGWPAAFVLLKPSLLPFAAIGINRRSWWIAACFIAVLTLPLLPAVLDYPRVLLDGEGGGLAYSLRDVPMLLIPLIAWAASRHRSSRPDEPAPLALEAPTSPLS